MKVLMVVNTRFELYYLSSVGYLLKQAHPETDLQLMIESSLVKSAPSELLQLYSQIRAMDFPILSVEPTLETFKRLRFLQEFRRSLRFRCELNRLDFDVDIVCIASFRAHFANIFCRRMKGRARLVAFRMADQEVERLFRVRRPLRSLYANLFNRAFGISTMEFRWHDEMAHGFSYWFTKDPYDRTICITDWGHGRQGNRFRLPPPFVALRHYYDLESEKDARPTIVVVGERTPLYKSWSSKDRSLYAHVFEFVREKFSKHRLLFRPREGLTKLESVKPFITGFEVMPADIPFEELCIRNSYSKVISIKSTACKVAAYCGDPAYVLFPLFDFPPAYRRIIEAYLSDAQDIVRVLDLRELLHDPQTRRRLDIDEMKYLYWQALMETTQ